MSAETSTLIQPAALATTPPPSSLEPLVDAVLRLLWALVGCYVWVVLLVKGPPARSVIRELEPMNRPQAD